MSKRSRARCGEVLHGKDHWHLRSQFVDNVMVLVKRHTSGLWNIPSGHHRVEVFDNETSGMLWAMRRSEREEWLKVYLSLTQKDEKK